MKSSFTKRTGSIISLKVELSAEEFKSYWQKVFDEELGQVHIKGFRPGQAPHDLAVKAVNQEKVFEKAAQDAVRETLHEAVETNHWTVIDRPNVSIEPEAKGFSYTADFVVFPEVKLGDYKKIAKQISAEVTEEEKKVAVSGEEIDKAFQWLKEHGANLSNFKTDDDLKKSISDGLMLEKKEREREKGRVKMLKEIVAVSQMEIPQIMIDRTKETHKLNDQQAKEDVANHLVIYRIAQEEKLDPSEQEVAEELRHFTASGAKISKEQAYNYVYGALQNRKVFQFLENLNRGVEK